MNAGWLVHVVGDGVRFIATHGSRMARNRVPKSGAHGQSGASKQNITATLKTCPKKAKPFVHFWTNGLTPAVVVELLYEALGRARHAREKRGDQDARNGLTCMRIDAR